MKTKKLLCFSLAVAMLLFTNACSGKGMVNTSHTPEKDQQTTDYGAQKAIENSTSDNQRETLKTSKGETDRGDKFGDILLPFQGEWQQTESPHTKIIVNGEELNFLYESTIRDKEYRDVNTFYFDIDSNGKLVVSNQYSQPRYNVIIDYETGVMLIESLTREDSKTYEKISDSTEVPTPKVEPEIGMTADEVRSSTWGAPQEINKTETANGEHEQWVYENGYIYFDSGYVTSIQN